MYSSYMRISSRRFSAARNGVVEFVADARDPMGEPQRDRRVENQYRARPSGKPIRNRFIDMDGVASKRFECLPF